MKVLVFVTDDGTEAGTGPILFVKDFATSSLPLHPRALDWKYFATVDEEDALLGDDSAAIREALHNDDSFIAPRLLRRIPSDRTE